LILLIKLLKKLINSNFSVYVTIPYMSAPTQTKEIIIYTWDHCPYCNKALGLLNSKGLQYKQIRLDGDEAAREEMSKTTKGNRKSVPQIFIAGVSMGGCDDLHALEASGELYKLI
jgi:glutaredoxin 3